jgi:hypothetical protein
MPWPASATTVADTSGIHHTGQPTGTPTGLAGQERSEFTSTEVVYDTTMNWNRARPFYTGSGGHPSDTAYPGSGAAKRQLRNVRRHNF